jgi:hypothetical protein
MAQSLQTKRYPRPNQATHRVDLALHDVASGASKGRRYRSSGIGSPRHGQLVGSSLPGNGGGVGSSPKSAQ